MLGLETRDDFVNVPSPYMVMAHPGMLGNERSIDSLIGLRCGSPSLEICWFLVIFSYFKSGVVLRFLGP